MPGVRRDRGRAKKSLGAGRRKAGGQDSPDREAEERRDQAKRDRFECEDASDLARREADRLQQPDLAVLLGISLEVDD